MSYTCIQVEIITGVPSIPLAIKGTVVTRASAERTAEGPLRLNVKVCRYLCTVECLIDDSIHLIHILSPFFGIVSTHASICPTMYTHIYYYYCYYRALV